MKEDNCKDAISDEEWSCIDRKLKKCSLHYGDVCKACKMDKLGRYMAVVEGWLYLAASQCSAPKDGKCVDWEIEDIIGTILSPHDRPFTGLCFPQSWDPLRPLTLVGNNRKKLNDCYGAPVACGCNYEIPALKSLPKPKRDKTDKKDKTTDKTTDKTNKTTDKTDKTDKTTKNKTHASSSKSFDQAGSSNKTTIKHAPIDKEMDSDTDQENDLPKNIDDDNLLDTPDDPPNDNHMDFSEGVISANEQPDLSQLNIKSGDSSVPDLNKNKTPSDIKDTTQEDIDKTPGDNSVTAAGASTGALQDSDSSSVVTMDAEMSDQPKPVELDAPLHTFTAEEDKYLLAACWDPNLSPRWTSSVHLLLENSKELLLCNWLCRGFESGYWHKGVPEDLWVPQAYKLLTIPEVYELKRKITGTLAHSSVFKYPSKTHEFYQEKEKTHRAAQESREKYVISVSQEQLYTLYVQLNEERDRQAKNGSVAPETVITPWVSHKLRAFVGDNLVQPVTGHTRNPIDCQWERVNTVGAKRRGSNASSTGRGKTAPTNFESVRNEVAPEGNTAGKDVHGDSLDHNPGGSIQRGRGFGRGGGGGRGGRGGGLNNKRARSTSSVRSVEQVPTKRGGGAGRGGQGTQASGFRVQLPANPRDCTDKSMVWECPLEDCMRHVNYNFQRTCFACKTYFVQDQEGGWVPSPKPAGQPASRGSSHGIKRGNRTRG